MIPNPKTLNPKIPTLKIPNVKIPNPKIPTPKIPNPKIPNQKIPNPKIPSPKIPDYLRSGSQSVWNSEKDFGSSQIVPVFQNGVLVLRKGVLVGKDSLRRARDHRHTRARVGMRSPSHLTIVGFWLEVPWETIVGFWRDAPWESIVGFWFEVPWQTIVVS